MKKNDLVSQAMAYGLILGGFETLKYIISVNASEGGLISYLYIAGVVITPLIAYIFAKRFCETQEISTVKFGRIFSFTVNLFFFAALIAAIAQYIHLQYIDKTYLATQFEKAQEILKGSNMMIELNSAVEKQGIPSAIKTTVMSIYTSTMYGVILALPIAAVLNNKFRRRRIF
ncbi:MAG: DUF4199 domain-containing protein [Bacteroidales bacterium]